MALSRAAITGAGLEILDIYGLGDLSMRRVADTLGVQAGALYYHVPNKQSLLAALADEVATLASRFDCTFVMEFANSIVNMKSMLGLLSQMLPMNESVVLRTEGEGENEAMDAMLKLLKEYEK